LHYSIMRQMLILWNRRPPEFNSTKKEKKSCETFKQQDFFAFKNDIKR
jgi:hypothetical protein